MPIILLALLLGTLSSDARAQRQGYKLSLSGPTIWIMMDTVRTALVVPGTRRDALKKIEEAYKSFKLKTNVADSVTGLFGNSGFLQSGSLAGRRMSSWIRCGEGITGPNADNWRVSMAILSSVEQAGTDSARVRTVVVASARNIAEGSAQPMMCSSSGQLEEAINLKVQSLSQ
jgi:hypothetical protein